MSSRVACSAGSPEQQPRHDATPALNSRIRKSGSARSISVAPLAGSMPSSPRVAAADNPTPSAAPASDEQHAFH